MSARGAIAWPLLLAAGLLGWTTGAWGGVALWTAPAALALVRRARRPLSVPGQVLLALGCGAVAFVWATVAPLGQGPTASEALRPVWAQVAVGALLLAGTRLHLRTPAGGGGATLGIGLLVFLACGTVRVGDAYPLLLVGYAVLGFAALRAEDVAVGGRPAVLRPGRAPGAATGVVVGVTVGLGLALAAAIPRFYALAYAWALDWVDERHRAGFHDGPLELGALRDLLQSDAVVMRVEGDAGDRLAGQVYVHYARGRWLPAPRRDERALRVGEADEDARPDAVVRAVVRHAGRGTDRFFVPRVPGALRLAPEDASVDAVGVVRAGAGEDATRLVVLRTGDPPFVRAEPGESDRTVPEPVRDVVAAVALDWTRDLARPEARLDAIRAHLERDFAYTLERAPAAPDDPRDPLVSFLTDRRAGHCEYFASAMTLLARAAGMPARLVTGYRVVEHSPIGGYAIVRERHAHAWAEVHLPGVGWVVADPTPLRGAALGGAEITPLGAALVDGAIVLGQRHGLEILLGVLVVGLVTVQLVRIRRDRARANAPRGEAVPAPPPWLDGVLRRLARAGLEHRASEPLEVLARRARRAASERAELGEAAVLLGRYAAWRYGRLGSGDALRADCLRWVEGRDTVGPGPGPGTPGASPGRDVP